MYFKTKTIHGIDLNMTKCSPKNFIWAIHSWLKGYGWGNRGHLKIDFAVDSAIVPWVVSTFHLPRPWNAQATPFLAFSMLLMTVMFSAVMR